MVALAVLGSVAMLCISGLVAFRWKLTHKTQSLSDEQEKRLSEVEHALKGLHIAQGMGRTVTRNVG